MKRAAALLLLGAVAASVWLVRIEIARPQGLGYAPEADTFRYFHPAAVGLHRELSQGRLPLWNPYQLAGQPTLALHVPAVLYPPKTLALALAPPRVAAGIVLSLNLFVAGLFTWLFAGRLGLSASARLAAALCFMLAHVMLVGIYMPPFLATAAWLPAVLWAVHGLVQQARARWAVALAAFASLSFLGGHSQGFVYAMQVSAVYGAFGLAFLAPRGERIRAAAWAAVAGVLTLGLVAPQLLPALELAREGVRGLGGVSFYQAALSHIQPAMLARGLLRGLAPASLGEGVPSVTLPLLTLPLVACGAVGRRQRAHWAFFLVTAIFCGLFVLGSATPLFRLFYAIPPNDLFRIPSRMTFLYVFSISLLLAIGIDAVERWLQRRARASWLPPAAAACLALGVGVDAYLRTEQSGRHPSLEASMQGAPASLIDFLRREAGRDRVFVQSPGFLDARTLYKVGTMNEVFAVPDYEPNMPGAYQRYFAARRGDGHPWHGSLYASSAEGRLAASLVPNPRLLDLMSVRYYSVREVSRPGIVADVRKVAGRELGVFEGTLLFERDLAVPRVYTVRRVSAVPDLEAALARLVEPSFRPLEEAVIVAAGPSATETGGSSARGADEARIVSYAPTRVELEARCGAACLVLLTDLHYPGWTVRVDGEPRTIERANAIFRGVWLEPGSHRLVYRFEPTSQRVGWVLALAAGLLALFVLSRPAWR